jgi:hypothetical protein
MKIIEIIVSPTGQTRLETKGFTGSECQAASRYLSTALGTAGRPELTAEYYTSPPMTQEQRTRHE